MRSFFYIFWVIILFYSLFSCSNSKTKSTDIVEVIDTNIEEEFEKDEVIEIKFNIFRFKSQLDSLLSVIEYQNFHFQLDIDTINEKSNPNKLWHFNKWGLFKIINSKKTTQLILYHFFDPKTSKVLRIYVIEASYNDSITFDRVHQSFLEEKDRKILWDVYGEGKEYYYDYRLTGLNDFVIILENKIYWLNVSSQYSKKNFNKIIDYFKDNLNEKNYLDTIKCMHY